MSEDSSEYITSEYGEIKYDDTLRMWKEKGTRIAFIYDVILEKYKRRVSFFTLVAFLLTSVTSLTALGNLGINDVDYPKIVLLFKIGTAVLTTCSAVATGITRIFGWSLFVDKCQKYLDSIEYFTSSIVSEQILPPEFRKDSKSFIAQHQDQFLSILNNAPDISHSDYNNALHRYEKSKPRFRQDLINV